MYIHILASAFMSETTRVMTKEVMMTFYLNSPILKQGEGGTWESASRWGENQSRMHLCAYGLSLALPQVGLPPSCSTMCCCSPRLFWANPHPLHLTPQGRARCLCNPRGACRAGPASSMVQQRSAESPLELELDRAGVPLPLAREGPECWGSQYTCSGDRGATVGKPVITKCLRYNWPSQGGGHICGGRRSDRKERIWPLRG